MRPKRHAVLLPLLLVPLLLLLARPLPAEPGRAPEVRSRALAAPRGDPLLRAAILGEHNRARAAVGVAPLAWSEALANAALAHAQAMARTGRFAHSDPRREQGRQGENLFAGTHDAYDYDEMVRLWTDEGRDFVNRPTPDYSRTGRWEDVTHYAQVVWRGTRSVGCALASDGKDDFLVCRYAPTGDVVGQRAY